MNRKPTNAADYMEALPADQRGALLKLRKQIRASAPGCEDHFGYGLPGFKLNGHPLVYFGAGKKHCALYGAVPPGFTEQLKNFKTSKGAIQFTPQKPLPAVLVKAILKAKVAENEMRWPVKKAKRTGK